MKKNYRIKECVIADQNALLTSMQNEEIKHHKVYHVPVSYTHLTLPTTERV